MKNAGVMGSVVIVGLSFLVGCRDKKTEVVGEPQGMEGKAMNRGTIVSSDGRKLDGATGLPEDVVAKMTPEQKKIAMEQASLRAQIEKQQKEITDSVLKQNQLIQQQIQMQNAHRPVVSTSSEDNPPLKTKEKKRKK